MCGVAGLIRLDHSSLRSDALQSMIHKMKFRGPDGEGFYEGPSMGMGMCRLSIIDLATGTQPIANENGDVQAVLNGEIYNYKQLTQELKTRGHQFKTNSDVECLVHLYEEKGIRSIQELNGMFGFCLYDQKRDLLWVARDRLGIKPLYYFFDGKTFAFSSNLDSLIEGLKITPEIDPIAVAQFLALSFVPSPRTIYKGIQKLPPGHEILIEKGKLEVRKFWDPVPQVQKAYSLTDTVTRVRELLSDSIALQIQSDVPVGSLLSGGVDSTIVTTLASQALGGPIKTFTVDFESKERNEGNLAAKIAKLIHSKHFSHTLSVADSISNVGALSAFLDEPMGDTAIVPSFKLSELAHANDVRVVLCGAGGDELFGGYLRHRTRWQNKVSSLRLGVENINAFRAITPRRIQHMLWSTHSEFLQYSIDTTGADFGLISDVVKDHEVFLESLKEIESKLSILKEDHLSKTNRRLIADLQMYLPDNILALFDKTSMASSIEGRVPLLDHHLVEFMLGNDQSKFIKLGQKVVLKDAYREYLPKEVLNQPKTGFNGPVQAWVRKIAWKKVIQKLQVYGSGVNLDWNMLRKHCEKPDRHNAQTLFNIYVLSQWLETRRSGNA
jgi:asparagine synthase (glutamine-hydrolysing)